MPDHVEEGALSREELARQLEEIGFFLEAHNAHLIRRAHQRATTLFQKAFEGLGVTPTQFAVLASLIRHGEMSQIALGQETAIDTATLSAMIRRLQQAELVERVTSRHDQRINLVRLTAKGVAFTMKALPLSRQVSEDVLAPLRPRERERFIALLKRLT